MKNEKQRLYIVKQADGSDKIWLEDAKHPTFHFASFKSLDQLNRHLKKFKITLNIVEIRNGFILCECSKVFIFRGYFWKIKQIPKRAKKIKALCNGSFVDCYYKTTAKKVFWYRPNPNAKEVYKPLSLEKHIKYSEKIGII